MSGGKGRKVHRVVHVENPETRESVVFGPGQPGGTTLPDWAVPLVTMEKVFEPFPEDDDDFPVNDQPVPDVDENQQVGVDGTQVGPADDAKDAEKTPAKKAAAKRAPAKKTAAKKTAPSS